MENPDSWGEAERVVQRVLNEHYKLPGPVAGLSLVRKITDALRETSLLEEE